MGSHRHCREHLCGYDLNLTYPQNGHFPTLRDPSFGSIFPDQVAGKARTLSLRSLAQRISEQSRSTKDSARARREERQQFSKRSLAGRSNGTLDPYYGCFIQYELFDYSANFSFPFSEYTGCVNRSHPLIIPL
jgi:carboxypeptidase D